MFSQYVTRAAARLFVNQAVMNTGQASTDLLNSLDVPDDTAAVARRLVYAIIDRLQRGDTARSIAEESLIRQLANRSTREAAEIFVAEVESTWTRKFREAYTGQQHAAAIEFVIEVASYLGAAAAGGIIGNRADATLTVFVKWAFEGICRRWRHRPHRTELSLSKWDAVCAAATSIIAFGYKPKPYGPWNLRLEDASQQSDGSWVVVLVVACTMNRCRERFRVRVPAGDPSNASIILLHGTERWSAHCAHSEWSFELGDQIRPIFIESDGIVFDEEIP
jgi:hypothetical protein